MKPRAAYRVAAVSVAVGAVLTVLAAFDGSWLLVLMGVLVVATGLVNLLNARRRGITWEGPKTFRELRALEEQRAAERSDDQPPPRDTRSSGTQRSRAATHRPSN